MSNNRIYGGEERYTAAARRVGNVIAIVFVASILYFSIIGIFALVTNRVNPLGGAKDQLNIALGKPYPSEFVSNAFDFSGMEETLKGIERQLERMNQIREIEKEGGDSGWEK